MTFVISLVFGIVAGFGIYSLRARAFPAAMALAGLIALAAGGLMGLMLIMSFTSRGQGGDSSMYAFMLFAMIAAGTLPAALVAMLVAGVQRQRIEQKWWSTVFTGLVDVAAILLLLFGVNQYFYKAEVRRLSSESWERELARRDRVTKLKNEIPYGLSEMPIEAIDAQRRQDDELRRMGVPKEPFLQPGVEEKIREYHRLRSYAEHTPQSVYQDLAKKNNIRYGLAGGGWVIGALVLPCFIRLRRNLAVVDNAMTPDSTSNSANS